MQFGKVDNPEKVDFSIPEDHADTLQMLKKHKAGNNAFNVYVGCAKWNRTDLKGFYPRGTKDELAYYATQFNSIELNATFYNSPSKEQVATWNSKTPEGFKFFPKLPNTISHYRRLLNYKEPTEAFCDAVSHFEDKLGMAFLQLHDNFKPKDFSRLAGFIEDFPKVIPLAVEVRNEEWFSDRKSAEDYYNLLHKYKITNILVDTAGRRDMMHMRLSTPTAFIRWVGANHPSDYERLDQWVDRIEQWHSAGLQNLYFFVHQNVELESPLLSAYFIEKLNKRLGINLPIPKTLNNSNNQTKLL